MQGIKRGSARNLLFFSMLFVVAFALIAVAEVVQLDTPADGTTSANTSYNFTATINHLGDVNSSLTNVTFYIGTPSTFAQVEQNSTNVSNSTVTRFNRTLSEGVYNWTFGIVMNNTHEILNGTNYTLTVDFQPPNATLTQPTAGNVSGTIQLNATANDLGAGIFNVTIGYENATGGTLEWVTTAFVNGLVYGASLDTTTLADQQYNISLNATDLAGFQNVTTNIVQILVDNTDPTGSITSPSSGEDVSGNVLLTVSASDSLSSVASVEVGYETPGVNPSWLSTSFSGSTWNATIATGSLSNGVYNISLNITDTAGNSNISLNTTNVNISNIVLNASLQDPSGGNLTTTTVFNASVNGSVEISSVVFGYDKPGTATVWFSASQGTEGFWNASFEPSSTNDGTYNLSVNATTAHGISTVVLNQTQVVIDGNGPATTITSPSTGTVTDNITISVTVSDLGTGLIGGATNISWRYVGSDNSASPWFPLNNISAISNTETNYTVPFDTNDISDDTYAIQINATDFTGNQNTSVNVSVTVDNIAATTSSSSSSSSSSGGGGGGGGGITVDKPGSAQAQIARVWASLTPEKKHEFKALKKEISIKGVAFGVKKKTGTVEMNIASLKSKPENTKKPEKAKVHQYLQIDHANLEEDNIEDVVITFTIPQDWLRDNRVANNEVRLYRYNTDTDVWQSLVTKLIDAGVEDVTFEAISPGLSLYAVGARDVEETPTVAPVEEPVAEVIEQTPTETEPTQEIIPDPTIQAPEIDDSSSLGLVALSIIVVAIVVAVVLTYYRKSHPGGDVFSELEGMDEKKPSKTKKKRKKK